jgi:hypothetical protein
LSATKSASLVVAAEHSHILHNARGRLPCDFGELKAVPMQMNGMNVITRITHSQMISPAAAKMKHQVDVVHRERSTIDRPLVESVERRIVLGEQHLDDLVGSLGGVIPFGGLRLDPDGFAFRTGIFHNHAHTVLAVIIGKVAENPDTGMIHLDDGGHSFRRANPQCRHECRRRDRVAVQSHYRKRVTRQCPATDFRRAGMQDMK